MIRSKLLHEILRDRIVIIDGAMGTMIQRCGFDEAAFRGERFAAHEHPLLGANDLLVLTQPEIIKELHRDFLRAGADIIETNTFNAQAISLADYGLQSHVAEINRVGAQIARQVADEETARDPQRPRFVAGSIGPTNRMMSLSPDVNNPAFRATTFDELVAVFSEQVEALLEGGVDLLQPETTIDTLNLKAALFAIEQVFEKTGRRVPVIASLTITDASGRMLAGQTVEAAWISIAHARPLAVGINCALGPAQMRPHLADLSRIADTHVACYPNAGLPNELGQYDETPAGMAATLQAFAREGLLNIVGGCCGTRPEHIAAIAEAVANIPPRKIPEPSTHLQLAGLEPLTIGPDSNFITIGERTNISGSRRFARLIRQQKFEQAIAIARNQVEGGANILDVNTDEGLIDSEQTMTTFLNHLAAEPDVMRIPIMIDSSKWSVIEAGLKCLQGKGVVNSISLKEGEEVFKQQAKLIKRYGAAVVVMAFDEEGQADTTERKFAIAQRAYRILTEEVGFLPQDVIFDPNILAVATGIEEHNDYAVAFWEATRRIKAELPHARVSGGVSNISFSLRGNNPVREAMHAAFLYHAIQAGMDMGIVNAGQLAVFDDVPAELREHVEDVLFNRRPDATERLIAFAETVTAKDDTAKATVAAWRELSPPDRLKHALVHGVVDYLDQDVAETLPLFENPLEIIEGPLMDGMSTVGDLFGDGKMFLPQVVKSARVMKSAVALLQPHIEAHQQQAGDVQRPKILLATVKGDVHDIGKNIVAVVLRCNGYDVVDLGVMVPGDKILEKALTEAVTMVGLSGLITPSLDEMVRVAQAMQQRGMNIPLLIGGATTSRKHTAIKIDTEYDGLTVHVPDASRAANVAKSLLSDEQRPAFESDVQSEYEKLRDAYHSATSVQLIPYEEAVSQRTPIAWAGTTPDRPEFLGVRQHSVSIADLREYIDWTPFFHTWQLRGTYPRVLDDPKSGAQARELFDNANALLDRIATQQLLSAKGVYGFFAANSEGDDVVLYTDDSRKVELTRLHTLRQQRQPSNGKHCIALADFVAPVNTALPDHIGCFAVTAGLGADKALAALEAENDDYTAIMLKALADRLAEAYAELLHQQARRDWGYGNAEQLSKQDLIKERYRGIRPAPGYPASPDHSETPAIFSLLDATAATGITLTESNAMSPAASICGLYLAHPQARYFSVGRIGRDQLEAYAKRKGMTVTEAERWLAPYIGE